MHIRKIPKTDYHVYPSTRMEQFGPHLTDFNGYLHLRPLRKSVEKIQVSLKSDNNNGYFTWRPMYIYENISLNFTQNQKCFRPKLERKSKLILY